MEDICSLITSRFDKFLCIERSSKCVDDSGCPGHQECIHDKCKSICRKKTCGRNAECEAKNHQADCKCASGFSGDPYKVCEKGQTILIWYHFMAFLPLLKLDMHKYTLASLYSDSAVDCCRKMGVPDECIGICKKKEPSSEPSRKQARPRSLARGDDGVILGICRNWLQSKVVKKCRELSSTKGIHLGI